MKRKTLTSFLLIAIVTATTQAATVTITLHSSDPENVTFSDGGGDYYDDWRIWNGAGGTGSVVFDEKVSASNIGDLGLNRDTRDTSSTDHLFNYTSADAQSGSGGTNVGSNLMLEPAGAGSPTVTLSASNIGSSGTFYLYSGGWNSGHSLLAEIGSDSDTESRSFYSNEFSDWWEVEYSGATAGDTLDITLQTTIGSDLKFNAAALNVVPEPSTLLMASMGLFGLAYYGWRRRRSPNPPPT